MGHPALADLDQGLTIDPKYPFALAVRGWAYLGIGEKAKAIDDILTAVAMDPTLVSLKDQLKDVLTESTVR